MACQLLDLNAASISPKMSNFLYCSICGISQNCSLLIFISYIIVEDLIETFSALVCYKKMY